MVNHVIGLIMLTTLAAAGDGGDVFGGAAWLRDPAFEGAPVLDLHHRQGEPGPELTGPKNVHTLFRKVIELTAEPEQALLYITGDDYYKFHINGEQAVQGPEPSYPSAHPYYWLDVTEFLRAGANCLASHSYYQGLLNRVWDSADNRSGFMIALDVTYAGGGTERFVTDASWKCYQLQAFPTGRTFGYETQYAEDVDMRLMPVGWKSVDFDDGAWLRPLTGRQDHHFMKQITPPLEVRRVEPVVTKNLGEGRYFYDFGTEIVGHTRVKIQGPEGHKLTVRHGEELSAPNEVRFDMRANCKYEEFPVLSGREEVIPFYDYKGFRYMEILDAPNEPEVWVDVRHHPFDESAATLSSSDELIENIWTLCKRGVQMGSQGGFLDCPTREKGQYLGDAVIAGRSHLWLTGDASLMKKALFDFALSTRIHRGMMAVAPGSFMQEIAEYSLQYPLALKYYYEHTGDRAFLAHMADTVFDGIFGYFEEFENEDGVLVGMTRAEKWVLVDWPANLRDGYDYDYSLEHGNTVLNAFYYGGLRTAAELMDELGRDGSAYEARAERLARAFEAQFVDPETGLYLDAPGSEHSSLHANAVPLAFGLTAGADLEAMLEHIREKGLNCGVYIASYVLEACFNNGAADLAYDLITGTGEHSWHNMLESGATTCMEAWGPEQKGNASWCHPWSSSPIYLLAEHVFGLSPAEPGWGKVRVAPKRVSELPDMTLRVPHPQGDITARYAAGEGFTVTVPAGVATEVLAPEGAPVRIKNEVSHQEASLSPAQRRALADAGWYQRVGGELGVWVSVDEQMFYLLKDGRPVWQARCATAAAGAGETGGSNRTPRGWHRVDEKIGDGKPWGQVFRARAATHEVWEPGQDLAEDLVLTRLLWLAGEEPGKNQGRDENGNLVDSKQRFIYIHGTNGEHLIGQPSSHGCVRLLNDDVITAFEMIPEGAPVLITASEEAPEAGAADTRTARNE